MFAEGRKGKSEHQIYSVYQSMYIIQNVYYCSISNMIR